MKDYGKILVACPTHQSKAYAEQYWYENVRQFTYHDYEMFVVDNSPTKRLGFYWLNGCDQEHSMLRITQSMEAIRQHFLNGDCSRWFNLEIDIIPPHDVIERMLELGGDTDWISHSYPMRGQHDDAQQGIGCSIFTRKLMENFNFNNAGDNSPDGWLWSKVRPDGRFTTMELWNYFHVEHLEK